MSDREEQLFGNYKLIRYLGDGSFADVYLGEHLYLKKPVAVKVLRTQLSKGDIESFFIEARTIASLEHPHIIRVLDCGVDHNVPFLVMNYASNGTLRQRHPDHSVLSPTLVLSYVKQVASALQYAHDRKLIHRDIKPHNMLLGPKDELWLSDFGLVLVAQSTMSQITQNTAGTPGYMAPEQFSGKPRPASDQYSLAVVVYEWLCGERPFHGSYSELFSQHNFIPAPPLREKVPIISPVVEEVVLTALAKDPYRRFASVQAFANALEQAYRSQPYLLPGSDFDLPTPFSQKGLPPAARQPISISDDLNTSAPTVLTSIRSSPPAADVIAIALDKSSPAPEDKRAPGLPNTPVPIEMPGEQDTPIPPLLPQSEALPKRGISRRALLVGLAGAIVLGSGAATLAWKLAPYASGSPTPPPPSIIELPRHAATPTPTPAPVGTPLLTYYGQQNGVKAAAWSPDGQFIVSGGGDKTVHIWNASNAKELLIPPYSLHTNVLKSVSWSPNGKFIASAGEDAEVRVWKASNGKDLSFSPYRQHLKTVRSAAWSPDGKFIASGSEDKTVHVWDAASGKDLPFSPYTGHTDLVITVAWSPNSTRIASASFDGTVRVWGTTNGQDVLSPLPHPGARAVAWSPHNGKYIVSGGDDKVHLWDSTTGQLVYTFSGHSNSVQSVAWSPDGQYIASGSFDKTVKIWSLATRQLILTYHHHTDQVWVVAWSPDEQRIASASTDSTVQIWKPL